MSAEDLRLPDFPVTERCGSGWNPRGSAESAGSPAFHVRIERCTGAEALSVRNQGTLETRSGLNGTCGECWEAGMGLRHAVAFRTRCAAELGRIGLYRPRFGVILESRKLQRLESVRAPSSVSVPRSDRPRRPCVRPKRPPSVRGVARGLDGSQSGLWLQGPQRPRNMRLVAGVGIRDRRGDGSSAARPDGQRSKSYSRGRRPVGPDGSASRDSSSTGSLSRCRATIVRRPSAPDDKH